MVHHTFTSVIFHLFCRSYTSPYFTSSAGVTPHHISPLPYFTSSAGVTPHHISPLLQELHLTIFHLCHISPLLQKLHWLPVRSRIEDKIILITFKAIHGLAPTYLMKLINVQQPSHYELRWNSNGLLPARYNQLTKKIMGDRSFPVTAPTLWNSLSLKIRNTSDINTFKILLKTFLFRKAY